MSIDAFASREKEIVNTIRQLIAVQCGKMGARALVGKAEFVNYLQRLIMYQLVPLSYLYRVRVFE